jgi:hypothetical protein
VSPGLLAAEPHTEIARYLRIPAHLGVVVEVALPKRPEPKALGLLEAAQRQAIRQDLLRDLRRYLSVH